MREEFDAKALARSGTFDPVEDDGNILSETALLASTYVKPRVDEDEVADQDWMQLAWLLRHECQDLFIEMRVPERDIDLVAHSHRAPYVDSASSSATAM